MNPEEGSLGAGLEHLNPEEAEENDFKRNLMKKMETFKQKVKTPLKKWKRIQTNIEEINKFLNYTHKIKKKQSNRYRK